MRIRSIITLAYLLIVTGTSEAACPVTLVGNSYVTMGDASGTIQFQLTNTTGATIDEEIRFDLPAGTVYQFVGGSAQDPCWYLDKIDGDGKQIKFKLNTGCSGLTNGSSIIFSLTLAGASAGGGGAYTVIPSAAQDVLTDQLEKVKLKNGGDTTYTCGSEASWPRKALKAILSASPVSVGVNGTFALTLQVINRSTAQKSGIVANPEPPTATTSGGAAVTKIGGPSASLTLDPGASGVITWTYRADSAGTVYFTTSARDSAGTATSGSVNSNVVLIGNFAASLSVSPTRTISGQNVTVTMTVYNNGSTTLTNITPSALTLLGTATKSYVSGPTPSKLALPSGSEGSFQWVYTVTGSPEQTYQFQGYATSGSSSTNTATSELGSIGNFSVTFKSATTQAARCGGGTPPPLTLTWQVCNNTGASIKEVEWDPLPSGWTISGGTTSNGYTGQIKGGGSRIEFENKNLVPNGQCVDFSLTFSNYPADAEDRGYVFPIKVEGNNVPGNPVTTTNLTLSPYRLTITPSPINCPTSITVTLEKCISGSYTAVSGATVVFETTVGSLSSNNGVTNSSGNATVSMSATTCAVTTGEFKATYQSVVATAPATCTCRRILDWREVVR